jgi:hypothetical protein
MILISAPCLKTPTRATHVGFGGSVFDLFARVVIDLPYPPWPYITRAISRLTIENIHINKGISILTLQPRGETHPIGAGGRSIITPSSDIDWGCHTYTLPIGSILKVLQ